MIQIELGFGHAFRGFLTSVTSQWRQLLDRSAIPTTITVNIDDIFTIRYT